MPKCKVKKFLKAAAQSKMAKVGATPQAAETGSFGLVDNGDGSFTVWGTTAAGNLVPIDDVATLTVISSDEGIVTVDPPEGMTFMIHAVGPLGHSDIMVTATWTDGSIGPFSFTLPVDVVAGDVVGIKVVSNEPVPIAA